MLRQNRKCLNTNGHLTEIDFHSVIHPLDTWFLSKGTKLGTGSFNDVSLETIRDDCQEKGMEVVLRQSNVNLNFDKDNNHLQNYLLNP